VDLVAQRPLQILTEIAERQDITQRGLAVGPGIAPGLANLTRGRLRDAIQPLILAGPKRLALYGTGEAAELTFGDECGACRLR
jgi:hypothetical protein